MTETERRDNWTRHKSAIGILLEPLMSQFHYDKTYENWVKGGEKGAKPALEQIITDESTYLSMLRLANTSPTWTLTYLLDTII